MSTGKRLAKRSIIGTRVCAQGADKLWYSGIIQAVKTPANARDNNNSINLTPHTKYTVRFDLRQDMSGIIGNVKNGGGGGGVGGGGGAGAGAVGTGGGGGAAATGGVVVAINHINGNNYHPNNHHHNNNNHHHHHHHHYRRPVKEFRENELIGPGFRSVMDVHLRTGQKIFITYNGRESTGEVLAHDVNRDEVIVKIAANGIEAPLELKKRLEEVRLLESRRSARLADQERDTDFARLADMAGDRRRASHNIDVPLVLNGSRKRRPSYSQDGSDLYFNSYCDDDPMDACNAALVLMSLSCSPHSPRQWNTTNATPILLGSSPGSSNTSWSSSGSASPPLSEENMPTTNIPLNNNNNNHNNNNNNNNSNRIRSTSVSTSDEGIVMDYNDETPRKRRANETIFQCTWKGCHVIHTTVPQIEQHVRNAHLGPKKPRNSKEGKYKRKHHKRRSIDADDGDDQDNEDDDQISDSSDHEEEFYYTEIEDVDDTQDPPSPPTLSHRDMARPPHEDPEYQKQIVGNFRQGLLSMSPGIVKPPIPLNLLNQSLPVATVASIVGNAVNIPTSPLAHHNYTWAQQSAMSPQKHVRLSPRPSTSYAPYPSPTYTNAIAAAQHNINMSVVGGNHSALTPNLHNNTNNTIIVHNNIANNYYTNNLQHQHQHQHQQHPHHQLHHNLNNGALNLSHSAPPMTTSTVGTSSSSSAAAAAANNTIVPHPNTTAAVTATTNRSPLSPNRRTRGENKKCRKVYGMDNKDSWCTQCKWKKACSRFGD